MLQAVLTDTCVRARMCVLCVHMLCGVGPVGEAWQLSGAFALGPDPREAQPRLLIISPQRPDVGAATNDKRADGAVAARHCSGP